MRTPLFTGSGVAIVTPFTKETVDLPVLGRLLDFQLENGTDAVIVCGTTGEAATMTQSERADAPPPARCLRQCAGGGASGSRRASDRHALLQQSHPAGASAALQGHCGFCHDADHPL